MSRTVISRTFALAGMMLTAAACLAQVSRVEAVPIRTPLALLPMTIDGWRGERAPDFDARVLAVLGADDYVNRTYRSPAGALGLYIGYYQSQRQGDSIHSPLNCLPGAGWQPIDSAKRGIDVSTAAGTTRHIEVNRVVVQSGEIRQVVLYWYQSHGRVIASEYRGKFYLVMDAVRLNRTDAALVRIVSQVGRDELSPDAATDRGVAFARALFPRLESHLPN